MRRTHQIAASLWVLLGFVLLGEDLMDLASSPFQLSMGYYLALWGFSAACIIGGGLTLAKRAVGRWMVITTAAIAIAHQLWLVLAYSNATNKTWVIQVCLFIVFALWVATIMVRKPLNGTVETDAQQTARGSL